MRQHAYYFHSEWAHAPTITHRNSPHCAPLLPSAGESWRSTTRPSTARSASMTALKPPASAAGGARPKRRVTSCTEGRSARVVARAYLCRSISRNSSMRHLHHCPASVAGVPASVLARERAQTGLRRRAKVERFSGRCQGASRARMLRHSGFPEAAYLRSSRSITRPNTTRRSHSAFSAEALCSRACCSPAVQHTCPVVDSSSV